MKTILYSTVQYSTVQIRYSTAHQYSTIQCSTIQYNIKSQYNGRNITIIVNDSRRTHINEKTRNKSHIQSTIIKHGYTLKRPIVREIQHFYSKMMNILTECILCVSFYFVEYF